MCSCLNGEVELEKVEVYKEIEIPEVQRLKSGKVREIFDLGDHLLMVATDRVSAFDYVIPNGIPRKGEILTQISNFWFKHLEEIVPNHLIDISDLPQYDQIFVQNASMLNGRSVVVKKCQPLAIECVVRGYLTGSGLSDYKKTGTICGLKLPEGLKNGSRLPEPVFTPATKAEEGHDENISFLQAKEIVGDEIAERVKELSLTLYSTAHDYALSKGIIIADTKFEFGMFDGELLLIDEVITPDSSRFWPAQCLMEGAPIQYSFDKQIVRNYLLSTEWDKNSPPPPLPEKLVSNLSSIYQFVYQLLTS